MALWSLKQYGTSKIIVLEQAHSLVGRSPEVQVFLPHTGVSRLHANLFLIEGNLWIQALIGVNGTFVNEKKIPVYKMHKLSPGDQIGFGMAKLKYAQNDTEKECFFEVVQTVETAESTSSPRRLRRCSARRITIVNEDPIKIESDDDNDNNQKLPAKIVKPEPPSNIVKMVLAEEEQVISSGTKLDEPVVATTDNPIVIDITDDAEDMDFSCSQILQMSQIVTDGVSDDVYQKIKNELAEMDYCNDGVVVNADLIDSGDDNYGGFENTQEIFEVLENTVETNPDHQVLEAIDDLKRLFEDEPLATPTKAPPPNSKPAGSKKAPVRRKSTDKKCVTQKDFFKELKQRKSSSPHVEVNSSLKEERRKKLKELTGPTQSPALQPKPNEIEEEEQITPYPKGKRRISGQPTVTTILGMDLNVEPTKASRRKSLNTDKRKKSASPIRSKSLTRPSVSATNQDSPQTRKSLSRDCKRLRMQTPSPTFSLKPHLDTNKLDNAAESATLLAKKKRGRPRKSVDDPKAVAIEPLRWQTCSLDQPTKDPKPTVMEPLRWQKYDVQTSLPTSSSNYKLRDNNKPQSAKSLDLEGSKRKRGRNSVDQPLEDPKPAVMEPLRWQRYDLETSLPTPSSNYNLRDNNKPQSAKSLDLDGSKRKIGRNSVDQPPEDPKPAVMEPLRWQRYDLEGNSAGPGITKGTTHTYHVNYHNSGRNQQKEASKLLMWSNGGPSRKPFNHRRLPEVNDIIREMVHWIPNRLLEQVQNDATTPIIKLPKKIPATFDNFHQYYDTFSKMVLMESWQCLYKGFRDSNQTPRKMKVQHARVVNDSLILDCISVISKEDVTRGSYYKPEDFVMLECAMKNKSHVLSLNFGFVQSCRRSLVSNGVRHSINQLLNGPNPHTLLEFTVQTRYQPQLELNTKMTHLIKPLINIRTYLMLIRTMKEMPHSPLCKMILKPQASDYKFPITHHEVRFSNNQWNDEQKLIVLEAASLCTGNRPGIYCVKGPPGTGKSTVIVNLLQQILFAEKHRKDGGNPIILLTAPSNTAVDNLIFKIGSVRNSLSTEMRLKIKLVRIGPESSIHKDILNYSLPKLAEKHLPLKLQDHPEIKAARERKENLIEVAKNVLGNQYQNELRQCEKLIIEKSNIICTTLNSCINARLIDAVNTGLVKFTCCVIDEATQCHEIESLLPIVLGIDKLVLVGDPQQLNATIMSREAANLGFGESLFTRLANSFGVDPRSPIKMLTEQYRMHPEICDFPNKHFYEGKLRTSANPSNKLPSDIRPYLVFNCEKTSHSDDYRNMDEVILIKKLLRTIYDMLDRNNSYTVGIITPYNAQKDLLVSHIGRQDYCQVTINTVDSFQGSEKDIIIISCVRDSSNSFLQNPNRLNVALTRAKQALYIIGNYSLFKECRLLYDIREDAKRRKVLLDIKQNPRTIEHLRRYLIKTRNSRGEYT